MQLKPFDRLRDGLCEIADPSSRLVTLCLSPVEFPTGDEFQWGEVGERLVRAHAVVGVFPMA